MALFGWLAMFPVGLLLGLLGGGGSILAVPVLAYLFGIPGAEATGLSLFLVGLASLAAAIVQHRLGNVDLKVALSFAAPAMVTVFFIRRFLMPAIPSVVLGVPKDRILLLTFAALMLVVSARMLWGSPPAESARASAAKTVFAGIIVGILAGITGAGGGFLIVPALLSAAQLPMKRAIGTSLAVIAAQSLVGFAGEAARVPASQWTFLIGVAAIAVAGALIGVWLARRISPDRLKKSFALFVLACGIAMAVKEIIF